MIDETEFVLALASEWLRLDSDDDWVRHDSGIVSHLQHLDVANHSPPRLSDRRWPMLPISMCPLSFFLHRETGHRWHPTHASSMTVSRLYNICNSLSGSPSTIPLYFKPGNRLLPSLTAITDQVEPRRPPMYPKRHQGSQYRAHLQRLLLDPPKHRRANSTQPGRCGI